MKTKDMKRGISLIVLIITIIVVIILAAVVILTLSKNNPIESAKEARFKEDLRTFQDELALYISKQYTNAGGHWDGNISAKTCDEIKNYIPSFTKKYEGKFIINNNNLEYTNELDEKEKEYAQNLNVKEKVLKLLPDEFQQVEYIESTGTQYIDTRNETTTNNKTEFVLEFDANNSNGWTGVNGSMQLQITGNTQKKEYKVIYYGNTGKQEIYIDSILNKTNNWGIGNWLGRIYVGKLYKTNGNENGISGYIYNLRVIENDSIVKNFIPCKSITTVTDVNGNVCPEGTKGMYDLVEGKFYTNQGTGEFIAGPDVNE